MLLQENWARPVEPDVTAEEVGFVVVVVFKVVVGDVDVLLLESDVASSLLLFALEVVVLLFWESPTPSPTPRPMARARRMAAMMIHITRFRLLLLD